MKAIIMLAAFVGASAPATQFDLTCKGTLTAISLVSGKTTEPYERRLRVDLTRKKYCEDQCKALFEIADVGPTQITFQDKDSGPGREREMTKSYVNRETGEHRSLSSSEGFGGGLTMSWVGACEKRPFSGFPSFETKF
jgi:hypothetical protein